MPTERLIRRYSAFFQGWAQAFGNHTGSYEEDRQLNWLFGEEDDQLGLILTPRLKRLLYREVLAHHETRATLTLDKDRIGIGKSVMPSSYRDEQAMRLIRWLFEARGDLHLYQTYHLIYPQGTRILTLSRKAPLAIIYKPIDPILIQVAP